MDVVFRAVLHVAAVVFRYFAGGEGRVGDFPEDFVVSAAVVGEDFEKGAAA
jgi:hypothetical protein